MMRAAKRVDSIPEDLIFLKIAFTAATGLIDSSRMRMKVMPFIPYSSLQRFSAHQINSRKR